MKRYFCTYFDSNYLLRGLAMCRSLARWCPRATIYVLALDEVSYEFLSDNSEHPYVLPLRLSELEYFDPELTSSQSNRSRAEYIFTMTPCLPRFLLHLHPEIDLLTYLDADLWFFSSPEPLFQEIKNGNVAIIPHRFADNLLHLADKRGVFNVGWISYANNVEGNRCLDWYRERCLEWCHDRVEDGRFADQKYLEGFSGIVDGVVSIEHKGANVATWNLGRYLVAIDDGKISVAGQELIFFHYQGLKRCFGPFYDCGLFAVRLQPGRAVRKAIFCSYIREVLAIKNAYRLGLPDFTYGQRYRSRFPPLAAAGNFLFGLAKMLSGYCVFFSGVGKN